MLDILILGVLLSKHSKRKLIEWILIGLELILFIGAFSTTYFSTKNDWVKFSISAIILIILFLILKIIEKNPKLKEAFSFDDYVAKLANSARKSGLIKYYNMQIKEDQELRNKDTQDAIDISNEMYLCANSGASYLDKSLARHWSNIEKKLNQGKTFKVILLNPYSKNKQLRNRLNTKGDSFDSRVDISSLILLSNKFPTLEIKFVDEGMYTTIFATEKNLFFDPYHIGVMGYGIEDRTFCMNFEPTEEEGKNIYSIFRAHFNTLWKEANSLKDWLAENSKIKIKKFPDLPKLN